MVAGVPEAVQVAAAGLAVVGFGVEMVRRIAGSVVAKVETTTAKLGTSVDGLTSAVSELRSDQNTTRAAVIQNSVAIATLAARRAPVARKRARRRKG